MVWIVEQLIKGLRVQVASFKTDQSTGAKPGAQIKIMLCLVFFSFHFVNPINNIQVHL